MVITNVLSSVLIIAWVHVLIILQYIVLGVSKYKHALCSCMIPNSHRIHRIPLMHWTQFRVAKRDECNTAHAAFKHATSIHVRTCIHTSRYIFDSRRVACAPKSSSLLKSFRFLCSVIVRIGRKSNEFCALCYIFCVVRAALLSMFMLNTVYVRRTYP